jgi:hypothetical protein
LAENESAQLAKAVADLTETLGRILAELKEINVSLKSIARSQAQQSAAQNRMRQQT